MLTDNPALLFIIYLWNVTSSKQFSIFLNRGKIDHIFNSIIICQIEGAFLRSRHSWSTIEHSTGIHGNKREYADKAEPKNFVSPSTKCLLVVARAIPPLTEATLSGIRDAFECSENFLSLLVLRLYRKLQSRINNPVSEKQRAVNPKYTKYKVFRPRHFEKWTLAIIK